MEKINSELKTVKTKCECTKCHRIFIFTSKFFDYYDFDGKCPKCYQEDNK